MLLPPTQVVDDVPMTDLERLLKHITPRLGPTGASEQDVKLVSQSLRLSELTGVPTDARFLGAALLDNATAC